MPLALTTIRSAYRKKLRGFTLVELIVVITILAILATIGFLALSGYSQDAKDSAVKTNVRSVQTAISSESAITGNSPRYFIVHDSGAALSGALVYVDGNPNMLTGGDWNAVGTNYSAGNPDYVKLKLNQDKFKTANSRFIGSAEAAYDSKYLTVGAVDLMATSSDGKKRPISYFQVAGTAPTTGTVAISGNFPTSLSGSVAGLVKDPKSSSSTGALLDGGTTSAYVAPVVSTPGVCGSANGTGTIAYPSSGLCAVGTASGTDLTGADGTFNWICPGTNGGSSPACSAPKSYFTSCSAILAANAGSPSGTYTIDPDGVGGSAEYQVTCDMVTDGGGWIVLDTKFTDYATWTNCTSGYGTVSAAGLWQVSAENGGAWATDGVHGGCGIEWRNQKAVPFRYLKVKTFSSPSNVSCGSVLFPNVLVDIFSSDVPATSYAAGYYPGWYPEGTNLAYKASGMRSSGYAANDTYDAAAVWAWGVHLGSGKYSTCWGAGSGYFMIK